jgi:putative membrane-bound dehydrogenase-like protein
MSRFSLFIIIAGLALCSSLPAQSLFLDRVSFAAKDRVLEQVPLEAFTFGPGFDQDLKIEIWAQSPMVFSPVAMDVDPLGRVWLTEGIDYNVRKRVESGQSIIVLTDSDDDGKADRSHVFVTERGARPAPLGIAVFDNKIVLSATPSIIVYTDVDRNAVFDPDIDTRETFLTGFQNNRHDHTLHAVIGSASGQWYFSYGNCGADIHTIDGRHFLSGCYYGHAEAIGKPSSDGHVYVGGVAMRIQPDGTGLAAIGHNLRNSHDMFVSSYGDVLQSDNDDPAHCRSTWLMEHGNMGYADLRDGSRSWEEVAKTWEEPQGWHKDLRYSRSHWRENYPGALPPGSIYGAGSPTGNVFIEGDELGENMCGVYLVCDMMRKEVMACRPRLTDAQIEMGKHQPFITLGDDFKGEHFLPTDIVLGIDGSLFLSDFYNDTSRRTNQVSGTIYRISRRTPQPSTPVVGFDTTDKLLAALQSPAINVRTEAVNRLKAMGNESLTPMTHLLESEDRPFHKMRPVWVLAQLGSVGQKVVRSMLKAPAAQHRLTAFRALRLALPNQSLSMAHALCEDPAASVRREVAVSLRDESFKSGKEILSKLISGYDGRNRWYLEALGIAATKKESEVYARLIRPRTKNVAFKDWDERAKNLAWRMHTPEAIDDLHEVIIAQQPDLQEFRHLAMAYARFGNDAERERRKRLLIELAALPAYAARDFQVTISEITSKDLNGLQGEFLTSSFVIPASFGVTTKPSDPNTIGKLDGHMDQGKLRAKICLSCHKIDGRGIGFGPNLTHWGQNRTLEEIIKELIEPSAKLAHGYDKSVRLIKGEHVAEGLLSNYSWHAGSLKIKLFGGQTKKILFRKGGIKVQNLENHSWMPPASAMGLTDQDLRDIAEYLKTLGS